MYKFYYIFFLLILTFQFVCNNEKNTENDASNDMPVVNIISPANNSVINNSTIKIEYTVSKDGKIEIKLDNKIVNVPNGQSLNNLTNGSHNITISLTDAENNKYEDSIFFEIVVQCNIIDPVNVKFNVLPKLCPAIAYFVVVFDGSKCVTVEVVPGCSCEPHCDSVFSTLIECESACLSTNSEFSCPIQTGFDCLPPSGQTPECTGDYHSWIIANCSEVSFSY